MPGDIVTLSEPSVNQLLSTWTGLRLERGPNATNLAAFTLVALIPYVPGQVTYVYTDSVGAPSDWYRVARYGPNNLVGLFSPAWPVQPLPITSGDGARRSLKNCRRVLARKLASLQVATTTADGNTAGTTLISTGLASQLDSNRYRAWWAMPTDGVSNGNIRRIGENAVNVTDGTLTVATAFSSQIVRGTQVELHKMLPPDELDGLLGLRQALNLALAECWVLDRLAVAGISNQITYDLSAFGDWIDPETINEFYGPAWGSGFPLAPWGGFQPRRQAQSVFMDVAPGISTAAAMTIELTRPADTYIKINGTWTDGQQGFQNDSDECLLQPSLVTEVALAWALDAIASTLTGVPAARWAKRAEDARIRANHLKFQALPHPVERDDHRATVYGRSDWLSWIR